MEIRDIVAQQRLELELRLGEPYVEREVAVPPGDDDLIRVVLGPRRSGKSFFAVHHLRAKGTFGYLNFDDERLVRLENYDELVAGLREEYGGSRRLLLDEVQNLPRWELFVNRLQRQGYRLTVTGSNAHLLGSELATHLTGRHLRIVLFPFSFSEFLKAFRKPVTDPDRAEALRRYAEEGGFPEPLLKNVDRRAYLSGLFDSVVLKDIVKRHRVRAVAGIEDLARYLLANAAREYSLRTLSQVTRCRSPHTVERNLLRLEEAFLFFPLRRFSYKVREQGAANKKIYAVDNGWIASAGFRFSADIGRLYENLVAVLLHRRSLEGGRRVFFWKNPEGEEVDFVAQEGTRVAACIQVCADVEDPATKQREVRALLKAGRDLRCRNLLVLTDRAERDEKAAWFGIKGRIRYRPLWKWLLNPDL